MTFCRQLAEVYYRRKLNRMYVHMLQSFIASEPWKACPPFPWRSARMHSSSPNLRNGFELGWLPMNMSLPTELMDQIKQTIETINVSGSGLARDLSIRTFLYTAICWWCTAVHPYSGPGILEAS